MRKGVYRRLADLTCWSLCGLLPRHLRIWGEAVRADVGQIVDDGEAFRYAMSSLAGLLPRALSMHIGSPVLGDPSTQSFPGASSTVTQVTDPDFNPRKLFLTCGAAAVFLGLVTLWMAGAPPRYLAINCVALLVGYVLLAILDRVHRFGRSGSTAIIWLAAAALLVTAMLGQSVEGASRWYRVAGLSLQTSLIVLPLLVLCFARAGTLVATAGVALAALAIALQPDRGMAGALAAGLIAIAVLRRDLTALAAAVAGVVGFVATLVQPDRLPAVPHVDQVLFTAFEVHPVAGLAALTGAMLLVLPAGIAWVRDPHERALYGAIASVWLAAIAAAALGNYPTPVIGYGGSAIIGYILALATLRRSVALSQKAGVAEQGVSNFKEEQRTLRASPAF
jgi:hypothetical protein